MERNEVEIDWASPGKHHDLKVNMLELLQRGASVHERNRAANSPLFLATLSGKDECAQLLKAAGAHLSVEEVERQPLATAPRKE